MNTWRNRLAADICSWVLTYIASDDYSRYIEGSIRYGMRAAAKDAAAEEARRAYEVRRYGDSDAYRRFWEARP